MWRNYITAVSPFDANRWCDGVWFRIQIAAGDDGASASTGSDPSVISQGNVNGPASPRSAAQVGAGSFSAALPTPLTSINHI